MKIKLIRGVRIGAVIALGVCMAGFAALGVQAHKTPITKEEERVKYEYSNSVKVNYEMLLSPNKIYDGDKLGEEPYYLTKLVKAINLKFDMLFNSSMEAKTKGEYTVSMLMQGYEMQDEKKNIIWVKKLEEMPKAVFEKTDKSHSVQAEIKIPYKKFNDFIEAMVEEIRLDTEAEIVVKLTGKKSVTIGDSTKEVPINTVVTIPLVQSYFAVAKEGTEEQKETAKETIRTQLPPDQNKVILYGILSFISLLGMPLLIIFTKSWNVEDKYINKRKKLFREHGSRMAAVDYIDEAEPLEFYRVRTLEDLIKIADEIEKPVFYKHNENILQITQFFVRDQQMLYVYELSEEILAEIEEEKHIKAVKKAEKEAKQQQAREAKKLKKEAKRKYPEEPMIAAEANVNADEEN